MSQKGLPICDPTQEHDMKLALELHIRVEYVVGIEPYPQSQRREIGLAVPFTGERAEALKPQ